MGSATAVKASWLVFALVGSVARAGDLLDVEIRLTTGGWISGSVLGGDDTVLLLDCGGFPYALGYDQLHADSAYKTRLAVLKWRRGGREHLTAADHFELGLLALRHNRVNHAKRDFGAATRLDRSYRARGAKAIDAARRARRSSRDVVEESVADSDTASTERLSFVHVSGTAAGDQRDDSRRSQIIAGYKRVGEEIRRRVGSDLTLVETPHFLIWTDWAAADRDDLGAWTEAMYTSLADRFGASAEASVFAGKCPVFCLRTRKRFVEVAGLLDHYDVRGALGYTSADANGHVHVVVCRQGGSVAALDAFASTLVHEGTHAFLHRYRTGRRIPIWLNEGLANYVAGDVLGDRCPNDRAAELVSSEIARGGNSIEAVFADDKALDARYYPVAHSLVAYLIRRNAAGFVGLIDDIKDGKSTASALEARFGLTIEGLGQAWRASHR